MKNDRNGEKGQIMLIPRTIFAVIALLFICNTSHAIDAHFWHPQTILISTATSDNEEAFYKVALGYTLNCKGTYFTDDSVSSLGIAKECKNIASIVSKQMKKKNVDKSEFAYFHVPVKSQFRDITEIGLHFDSKQSSIVWRIKSQKLSMIDIYNRYIEENPNLKMSVNDDMSKEIRFLFSKETAKEMSVNSPLINYAFAVGDDLKYSGLVFRSSDGVFVDTVTLLLKKK